MTEESLSNDSLKFCGCGCGELLHLEKRFILGHQNRLRIGKNNPRYRNGKHVDSGGYIRILIEQDHPRKNRGKIFEHLFIMEKHLGRYLTKDEVVHHINEIKTDNRIENLQVMSKVDHLKLHHLNKKYIKRKND